MTRAIAFRPRDEAQEKAIDKYMKENDLDQTPAMRNLLDKALNMENRYQPLDDACPALCFIDDHYECWWGRLANTPQKTKIGKTEDAVKQGCKACKDTLELRGLKEENKMLREQAKKEVIIKLPTCFYGGQLSPDGKKIHCKNPKMIIQYRDVEKFCKIVRNGANCEHLKWATIQVKGKLPDGQNL